MARGAGLVQRYPTSKSSAIYVLETRSEIGQVGTSVVSTLAADQPTSSVHWDIDSDSRILDGRGDLICSKGNSGEIPVLYCSKSSEK